MFWNPAMQDSVSASITLDSDEDGEVSAIAWSSDGTKIIVGSDRGVVRIYELETLNQFAEIRLKEVTTEHKIKLRVRGFTGSVAVDRVELVAAQFGHQAAPGALP